MYEMTEVQAVPERRRRNSPHVNQLRAFLGSGKEQVQLVGVHPREVSRVYNGLKQASGRPEFKGQVAVQHYGDAIYLIRSR